MEEEEEEASFLFSVAAGPAKVRERGGRASCHPPCEPRSWGYADHLHCRNEENQAPKDPKLSSSDVDAHVVAPLPPQLPVAHARQ